MSMFDYYRPTADLRCPVCLRPLPSWQGKDGPNGLFVRAQGIRAPVDQAVDEESRLERDARDRLRLPSRFIIYSHDCPDHRPIDAECVSIDGVWCETALL